MSRLLSCKEASSEPGLIVGLVLNILTDCEFPLSLSDLSTYSFSIEGNIMDQYCIDDTFLLDSGLPTLEKAFEHTIHWCVPSWPLSRISSKDGLITGGEFLFLTHFGFVQAVWWMFQCVEMASTISFEIQHLRVDCFRWRTRSMMLESKH